MSTATRRPEQAAATAAVTTVLPISVPVPDTTRIVISALPRRRAHGPADPRHIVVARHVRRHRVDEIAEGPQPYALADGRPALHGGGFYARAGSTDALLHRTGLRLHVQDMPAENIDYYRLLSAPAPGQPTVRAGDTAVLAFRTQMFVTRSNVAVVAGLSSGAPKLTGLYDALGRAL